MTCLTSSAITFSAAAAGGSGGGAGRGAGGGGGNGNGGGACDGGGGKVGVADREPVFTSVDIECTQMRDA